MSQSTAFPAPLLFPQPTLILPANLAPTHNNTPLLLSVRCSVHPCGHPPQTPRHCAPPSDTSVRFSPCSHGSLSLEEARADNSNPPARSAAVLASRRSVLDGVWHSVNSLWFHSVAGGSMLPPCIQHVFCAHRLGFLLLLPPPFPPTPLPPSTPSFSPRASPKHVGWAWSFLLLRACSALSLADSSHREIGLFFFSFSQTS